MLFSTDRDILRSLGNHRVVEAKGSLPQPAWKLDNTPVVQPSETLVDVHALHIDSASFTQFASKCDRNPERMKKHMLDIVAQRGKMHNPVTGSGEVLVGTVREIDEIYEKMHDLAIGDIIISLTSLRSMLYRVTTTMGMCNSMTYLVLEGDNKECSSTLFAFQSCLTADPITRLRADQPSIAFP